MGCSRVRNLVPESGACLLGDRTVSRLQQASRETDLKKFKNFSKGNAVSANLLRGSVRIFARFLAARCFGSLLSAGAMITAADSDKALQRFECSAYSSNAAVRLD
jgi:hypothetical protein